MKKPWKRMLSKQMLMFKLFKLQYKKKNNVAKHCSYYNVDEFSLKKAINKIEKNYQTFKKNSSRIFLGIDNESTISENLKKIKF